MKAAAGRLRRARPRRADGRRRQARGVGVGTVYRHFPTKEALIDALAIDRFEQILAAGKAALEIEDPWEAFTTALWAGAELLASDRSFTEIVGELQAPMPFRPELEREMNEIYTEFVRRAQESGQLRADLVFDDVPMLMCGIGMARSSRTFARTPGAATWRSSSTACGPRTPRELPPAAPSLWGMTAPRPSPIPICKRSRGTSPTSWTAPGTTPRPRSTPCSPRRRRAPTRSPRRYAGKLA